MSERKKPSTSHEYDKSFCCIHCGVYKVNIEAMTLNCTVEREKAADAERAKLADAAKKVGK